MFARSIQKTAKDVSKHYTSKRGFFRLDRDLDLLADSMRTFMRRGRRGYDPYDYHRQQAYYYQPVYYQKARPAYEQKVVVYENDGSVLVKTFKKRPGRHWETYVEEYANEQAFEQAKDTKKTQKVEAGNKTVENKVENKSEKQPEKEQVNTKQQQTVETKNTEEQSKKTEPSQTTQNQGLAQRSDRRYPGNFYGNDVFSQFDRHFQEVSNAITKDFDAFFGKRFNTANFFENDPFFTESQNTPYHSKTVVNDNGNVTVKTVKRNADGQWETNIERYNEKDRAVKDEQKLEAVAENKSAEQKTVDQPKTEEAVEPQTNVNQAAN